MIHVQEINDVSELAGYRLLWNLLLPQTRGATFFQSLDWLEVYWKHFGAGQRLRVLIVSSNDQPVGILPLVVRTETTRVGRLRVLTYPLHDWGSFYGPIGPNPTATLTAGLQHIRQTRRDWDMLDLRWVDLTGVDHGRTSGAMERAGFEPAKQAWNQAAVIELDGTWGEYFAGRTKKHRHNIRRCRRRLAERGQVTHIRYRPEGAAHGDDDPRWDLFESCVDVARRSWQGSSTNGTTLSHDCMYDYVHDTHAVATRCGALDLNLLLVDNRPVAFAYNYHYQGEVHALRKGFDPDFSAARPGTVLAATVIEDSFRREDSRYDMGIDSLHKKRHWQTSLVTSYRYTHFPISVPRAQLLRMNRWLQCKIHGEGHVACPQTV